MMGTLRERFARLLDRRRQNRHEAFLAWGSSRLDALRLDLRYALRASRKTPGLSAVAIFILAIGIGASTALFTVVHGVLLKPLPYRDAERLMVVLAEQDFEGAARPARAPIPAAALAGWPPAGSTFDRIAFYSLEVAAVPGRETAELIDIAVVSGTFFQTIDGTLVTGRGLLPGDDLQPVAVISERLWRRSYAGAADVVGRSLTLNGQPFTIVGVAAGSFQIPQPQTDTWIPAGFFRIRNPACCGFRPIALAKPGASPAAISQEMSAIAHTLAAEMPRTFGGVRVRVLGLREVIVGDTRPALLVLLAAVALLLLLACANVVNLLLARAAARAHETSIRRALGAPRRRLAAQALAESAVLTAAGGAAGIALAAVSVRALKSAAPAGLPRLDFVQLDGRVLLFTSVVAAAAAVAVALLPALHAGEVSPGVSARQRGTPAGQPARVALRALTVVQLAISIVLLVGALLLGRSLVALMRTDIGVRPENVATASLDLTMTRTLTDRQLVALVDRVTERIAARPEVTAVGVGTARPPNASRVRLTLNRTGDAGARASYQAAGVPATPGYFHALGVRLEQGRVFTEADHASARPVVITSADTARRLFGDESALGRTIELPVLRDGKAGREEMTVVGVTANVKYSGLDQAADDLVYRPFAQQPWRSVFLVARTTGDPRPLASQLRGEIAAVDPEITVADVMTFDAVLSQTTAQPRFRALLLTAFAGLALVIAVVGLYGVVAYSVSQRGPEIGVRMALGADSRRIRVMVLREGMLLALAGAAAGLTAAYGLAHVVTALLYGVAPTDPASYGFAAAAAVGAGLLASYIPAARATRTDPLVVLKAE